ncbi:hypothetical protein HGB13_02290 [bacterium]|nr:hypothetical protein [bacterium]
MSTHKSSNLPPEFAFVGVDKIIISGYGREGKETYKFLKKYLPNKKVSISKDVDSPNYKKQEKTHDISIKSPGIPSRKIGINYTTATNIFLSKIYSNNQVIGVTGSKGKSTTASLIFSILKNAGKKVKFMGNIGKPMLSEINSIKKDEVIVLELSSYQLEDLYYSPNIAVTTNLFPDHMDYHGGLEPYYKAKKNIINHQKIEDVFFYNSKNKILSRWAKESVSKPIDFSSIKLPHLEASLSGSHNISNIKAAVAVSRYLNVSDKVISETINSFKPLPHRMELIKEFRGISFYDDAISTTPDSTIAAIKSINKVQTIFLGGEDRGYDFSQLEKEIVKSQIRNIVLFPDSGLRIFAKNNSFNILKTKSMKSAVKFAFEHTDKGYACLLSCASPSYSLWKNFEEKGNEFKKYINLFSHEKKETE